MNHIELKSLIVQEWLKTKHLDLHKVNTDWNDRDILTKGVPVDKQIRFGRMLGMHGAQFDNVLSDAAKRGGG